MEKKIRREIISFNDMGFNLSMVNTRPFLERRGSLHIFHLMANTTMVTRVFILALIILSTFFMTLQARNLHGHPSIRENNVADNNHRFLHNYLDLLKHIHLDHQDADDAPHKDGNTHRLTPEGPDPHHNFATPPRN
ncbi:hypothetical protein JHK87_034485 [Glycine soja]|nr:hypothetical protein JHK87_034485 [Glycine soja]